MARPTTKNDLIKSAKERYEELIELINSLSKEDKIGTFNFDVTNEKEAHWKRDKNIRDVLIHLYEWHQLLINWIENNINGVDTQFLVQGYNWKTYGDMNIEIFKKHQNTTYKESIKLLDDSHKKVIKLAENFNDEQLFSKGVFKWVGGSTLGSYFVSNTSSHYVWAIKKIKKYKKDLNK